MILDIRDHLLINNRYVQGFDLSLGMEMARAKGVPDHLSAEFLAAIEAGAIPKINELIPNLDD